MRKQFHDFVQSIKSSGPIAQTILFIFGLLVILFIGYALFFTRAHFVIEGNESRSTGFEIIQQDGKTFIKDSIYLSTIQVDTEIASAPAFGRIMEQLASIRMRYQENQGFFKLFFKIRYGVSMIQAISALLALVIGLIISKIGWANVKSLGLISFFVFTAFAAILQLLPESLNIDENIKQNDSKFREYKAIEAQVLTYLSTQLNEKGDTVALPQYIIQLDKKIAKAHELIGELRDFPSDRVDETVKSINNIETKVEKEEE